MAYPIYNALYRNELWQDNIPWKLFVQLDDRCGMFISDEVTESISEESSRDLREHVPKTHPEREVPQDQLRYSHRGVQVTPTYA